jgi:hypothetical protein
MTEIKWGRDVQAALALAEKAHKPVYLDICFEG